MTITPQQAYEKNLELNQAAIARIEKIIDSELKKRFFPEGALSLYIEIPEEISLGTVIPEIKRRYGEAGWCVDYESNQRDGEFFIFKEKKNGQREIQFA